MTMSSTLGAGRVRGEVGVGTGVCTLGEHLCEANDEDQGGVQE